MAQYNLQLLLRHPLFPYFFVEVASVERFFYIHYAHVFHGLVNILAGVLRAIPIIGSFIYGIQFLNTVEHSDDDEIYVNEQRHKFFGYKTLRDNT